LARKASSERPKSSSENMIGWLGICSSSQMMYPVLIASVTTVFAMSETNFFRKHTEALDIAGGST